VKTFGAVTAAAGLDVRIEDDTVVGLIGGYLAPILPHA
jgi:ABC-type branched-subunit amino acid transport system ATPase component